MDTVLGYLFLFLLLLVFLLFQGLNAPSGYASAIEDSNALALAIVPSGKLSNFTY